MLNGQFSDWSDVRAGVLLGSILGPLLFLIYTNDLSEALSANAKVFADDTSLFPLIYDSNTSALELNSDFSKINRWRFQWKMSFNPVKKQAQKVIFSRKSKAIAHPPLIFNNNNDNNVIQTISKNHLGIILDIRLFFVKSVLC